MKQLALCHTCRHRHTIEFDPKIGAGGAYSDWITKHAGHVITFESPSRRQRDRVDEGRTWDTYLSNADVKAAYAASASLTITLASLAASSTLLGGRESTAIDNGASNKYLDEMLAGNFKSAAANAQVGSINVAVVGCRDDAPAWPDVFDGTDSTETVSQQSIYDQVCRIVASIATIATNDITYSFGPTAIAGLFGGVIPDQYVVFVSQSAESAANVWSATEGDHAVKRTPVYATVI